MKDARLFIGTSGWNYKAWKDDFYAGIAQKRWLEHYAHHFNAVEVNATFYRLLKDVTLQGWHDRTPEHFRFCCKGSRYITHTKRLKDPQDSVALQKENLAPLQSKLRAVIWQLPASFSQDLSRLESFARALQSWPETCHVVEFRHSSWFNQEVLDLLTDNQISSCISDAADWPRWDAVSVSPVYIRLHGDRETYRSSYTREQLEAWSSWIQQWLDQGLEVCIFFDNTDDRAAYQNGQELQRMLKD